MTEIESPEAEAHFGDVLQRVRDHGEKFVVTAGGEPVATICPLEDKPRQRGGDVEAHLEETRQSGARVALDEDIVKSGGTWKTVREAPNITPEGLEALLDRLSALSKKVASRGPLLKPGQTLKEFAREGLE